MATDFTNNLADASTSRLAFATEGTWGVIPTTAARVLRFTSESLTATPTTIISDEITSNRAVADLSLTHYEASGDVSGEFSPYNWDEFLAGALVSEEFAGVEEGTLEGAVLVEGAEDWYLRNFGGSPLTLTETTARLVGLKEGGAFNIKSESVIGENKTSIVGIYTIASLKRVGDTPTGAILEIHFKETFAATANTAEADFEISSQSISDASDVATSKTSFALEKYYPLGGTKDKHILFQGMLVNTLNLSVASRELATLTLGFLGKNALAVEEGDADFTAINSRKSIFTGAVRDPEDTPTINASSNVGAVYQGGNDDEHRQSLARSITLDINNNLRGQSAIGSLPNVGVGVGRSEITGTIEVYFKDLSIYKNFLANGESSLRFILKGSNADGDPVSYVIHLPRIKFSDAGQPITGNNTDIITSASFQALYDADSDASIIISRV